MARKVYGPQDLPWLRERIGQFWDSAGAGEMVGLPDADVLRTYCAIRAQAARHTQMTWADPEMLQLAAMAAEDDSVPMGDFGAFASASSERPGMHTGMMVWGHEAEFLTIDLDPSEMFGPGTGTPKLAPVIGVEWLWEADNDFCDLHLSLILAMPSGNYNDLPAFCADRFARTDSIEQALLHLSTDTEQHLLPQIRWLLRTLSTAFAMMAQPGISDAEPVAPLHRDRKAAKKSGRKPPEITRYTLRRLRHVEASHDESGRRLSCRFIVRPHWRNQWLPKTRTHRRTLINAYIKGPSDAPLRITERVNVWRQ